MERADTFVTPHAPRMADAETKPPVQPAEVTAEAEKDVPAEAATEPTTELEPDGAGDGAAEMEESGNGEAEEKKEREPKEAEARLAWKVVVSNLPRFSGVSQVKKILVKGKVSGFKRLSPGHSGQFFLEFPSEEAAREACQLILSLSAKGKPLGARVMATKSRGEHKRETFQPLSGDLRLAMLDATIPLRDLPYEEQLKRKMAEARKLHRHIVGELAGEHPADLLPIIPCPSGKDAKRNKCEMAIAHGQDGRTVEVGFKAPGYKAVAGVGDCLHVSDEMKALAKDFAAVVEESGLSVGWDEVNNRPNFWRQITLRQFGSDLTLIAVVSKASEEDDAKAKDLVKAFAAKRPEVKSLYWSVAGEGGGETEPELLSGSGEAEESLLGLRFRVSPGAFFQTISVAAERLYSEVRSVVERSVGGEDGEAAQSVLLDICCGTGTLGLILAPKVRYVLGLELCAEAVRDAKANQALNGVPNAAFLQGRAEDLFNSFPHYLPADVPREAPVVGILDPPRAGLHSKLIGAIRRTERLRTLVYVSCHPRLAKQNFVDLCRPVSNKFAGKAFTLKEVRPVDMFPNTAHAEWLLLFLR